MRKSRPILLIVVYMVDPPYFIPGEDQARPVQGLGHHAARALALPQRQRTLHKQDQGSHQTSTFTITRQVLHCLRKCAYMLFYDQFLRSIHS